MTVPVFDPFDAAADPQMPSVDEALDPGKAQSALAAVFGRDVRVAAIRVVRRSAADAA